jgi:putative heme-binding domain-containing protein
MRCWIWLALLIPAAFAQPAADLTAGRKIFESQCALCHGQTGGGGRGPSLSRAKLGKAPDDAALKKLISDGIPPEMPGAWQLHPKEIDVVAGFVRSLGKMPPEIIPGDPDSGAKVYRSKGCPDCHIISGRGEGFGPELTSIGARRSASWLRQALLKPSESLPEDFLYVAVTPATGPGIRGIRVNEDTFTIQIKDAGGKFHSFRKTSLKELRRLDKETPMPSFEGQLTKTELDDLVAYLASLKGGS